MNTYSLIVCALLPIALHANMENADIKFWAGQEMEHVEFALGFTADPLLQKEGKELLQEWKKFEKNHIHSKQNQKEFLRLSDKNLSYQNKVATDVKKSNKAQEEKNLQKALLNHMDIETKYAKDKARGKKFTKEQEAKFWSEEHEGEAHVLAVLMKPNEPALKAQAEAIEKELKLNHGTLKQSSVEIVEKDNARLDQLAQKINSSNNSIPRKLADHEARERKYAASILQ